MHRWFTRRLLGDVALAAFRLTVMFLAGVLIGAALLQTVGLAVGLGLAVSGG